MYSIFNLMNFDYFRSQNTLMPPNYKARRCADLDLVQRFELARKLEGHQGCVNAM